MQRRSLARLLALPGALVPAGASQASAARVGACCEAGAPAAAVLGGTRAVAAVSAAQLSATSTAAAAAAAARGGAPSTSGRGAAAAAGAAWGFAARGVCTSAGPLAPVTAVRLNALSDAPGATAERKRWGRGNGGDRGTYCGRGIKGQKSRKGRKPGILFDGGQKGLKKLPKVGATPSNPVNHVTVNLETVMDWVRAGRLDATQAITMQDLRNSGAVAKRVLWGVKLLGQGAEAVDRPLHLQVSAASAGARAAVEAAGGSVTTVYYNKLGLRALLKPELFERKGRRLPSAPRAWAPRDNGRYDAIGAIPPNRTVGPAAPALPGGGGGGAVATAAV